MKIITLSLLAFIVLMLGMGAYMMYATQEKPEGNYYEMDLAYQSTIEARQNTERLSQKPTIQYDSKEGILQITFPAEISKPAGKVQVLNIANQSQDLNIKLSGENVEAFSLPKHQKGLHQVIISWESNGKSYSYDEKIAF